MYSTKGKWNREKKRLCRIRVHYRISIHRGCTNIFVWDCRGCCTAGISTCLLKWIYLHEGNIKNIDFQPEGRASSQPLWRWKKDNAWNQYICTNTICEALFTESNEFLLEVIEQQQISTKEEIPEIRTPWRWLMSFELSAKKSNRHHQVYKIVFD